MFAEKPSHDPEVSRIGPGYDSPYEAIIKPHVVMGVSRYFLERWVPVLGPGPATVVNTLRQLTYHTPNAPITIAGETLAREAAMSRRYLYTCLESPWIRAFVHREPGQRLRSGVGRVLQQTNRYRVQSADPLNPADAEALLLTLPTLAATPLEAVRAALNIEPRKLWAPSATAQSSLFPVASCITAQTVLQRAFPAWSPADADQRKAYLAAGMALHSHVTLLDDRGRPKKVIVPQYFRQHWWSHLGHDLAWAYLWLRGEVYENPTKEVSRTVCWIASLEVLLNLLNRPYEWWRRNVEKAPVRNGWHLNDFFVQRAMKKGFDSAAPQLVARQFVVALDLPIAPQDRERYSNLVIEWPDPDTESESLAISDGDPAVNQASASGDLPSAQAARPHSPAHNTGSQQSPEPHSNTPEDQGFHTSVHTSPQGVPGIRAQASLANVHKESESLSSSVQEPEDPSITKSGAVSMVRPQIGAAGSLARASTPGIQASSALIDCLVDALEQTPERSLAEIADISLWLQQAWPEPIQPHTPAWTIATGGDLTAQEVIALMMSVWADSSIRHPPRYLSWLMQRWRTQPDMAPVSKWDEWKALADLPLGQWETEGRRRWASLVAPGHASLPFGLDIAISEAQMDRGKTRQDSVQEVLATRVPEDKQSPDRSGLDEHPGASPYSIDDIWRATLGQLSLLVGRSTYTNWVEGARAIAFKDGVLTVKARHHMARELLASRLNKTIEETVSSLAQAPITVRYVL